MTEDYPRYPDIHDLDLTLLNPRMIVVRPSLNTELEKCFSKWETFFKFWDVFFCCILGCHPLHESVSLHSVTQHPHLSGVQLVQDNGSKTLTSGQRCWRSKHLLAWIQMLPSGFSRIQDSFLNKTCGFSQIQNSFILEHKVLRWGKERAIFVDSFFSDSWLCDLCPWIKPICLFSHSLCERHVFVPVQYASRHN